MALTVIPTGNALLTNQQDYVRQNDLIAGSYLDQDKIFPIDFTNNEIIAGSIFNFGGTILKAITAESINGTPTDFVRININLYTASYASNIAGVSWSTEYNGYYDTDGNLYVFDEIKAFYNNSIPKIRRYDSYLATSLMINALNTVYSEIGIVRTIPTTLNPSIVALSDTMAALAADGRDDLIALTYNNGVWKTIGTFLPITGLEDPSIERISDNALVMVDSGTDNIQAYQYDTGTGIWSTLGPAFALTTPTNPVICFIGNGNYALFQGGAPGSLSTYNFSGTAWSLVGSSLSISPSGGNAICRLSDNRIALITSSRLSTYQFNGSTWTIVGNALSLTTQTNPSLARISDNQVLSVDQNEEIILSYTFDGIDWVSDGMSSSSIGTFPSLSPFNDKLFAYCNNSGELRSYRRIAFE